MEKETATNYHKIAGNNKTGTKKVEISTLIKAFQKASEITFSLVFLPSIFLLVALFLDKKYQTTPIFIIIGIVLGVSLGILKATNLKLNRKEDNKK
jgi:F0F1-type ATP synthase assembly protein I